MIYPDEQGTPYCPAYPSIQGAMTGLVRERVKVKREAVRQAAIATAEAKTIIATLANLKVQEKMMPKITQGLYCMRSLHNNSFKFCRNLALKGDLPVFIEKFVNKSRHPWAWGAYCEKEAYLTYLTRDFPDTQFYEAAKKAREEKTVFCPHPNIEHDIWRPTGEIPTQTDLATGMEHQVFFDDQNRHTAAVMLKL